MNARTKAAARRDAGIEQATDHANAVEEDWSERAWYYLEDFLHVHPRARFITEEVREYAAARGFTSASERAWGSVIREAAKKGLIVKVGYAPAKSSNLSPKCQWQEVAPKRSRRSVPAVTRDQDPPDLFEALEHVGRGKGAA